MVKKRKVLMSPKIQNKFNIIQDTREQLPLCFDNKPEWCSGTITKKLDTGDYSLEGFENKLAIERKRSTSEIATNIFESRFPSVLERLNAMPHAFIICEFTWDDINRFPEGSGIPRSKWPYLRVSGALITKTLTEFFLKYPNIHWIFINGRDASQKYIEQLFKRMIEHG